VAQRVGRGIALLFHDRNTRRGCMVSSTPRPHFTPGKDSVPILQEAGWAPGPVWMGGKSRPHRYSIPDRPARSSVAVPTELPGPKSVQYYGNNLGNNILDTSAKLRRATVSFVMSVRPRGTTRLPLDRRSLNFIFECFSKICR